ncbi:hypothetical protein ADIS_3476 [Lunatimonas lonarensis]|uniref:Uncharacterized protein n=1 Tax=Lunatimonas lonarensis TaxID=1232681 RepID=R7ZQL8_9BACT|nr:hypothetical protein ADIS_3476 [Lunatimonas lonarensis]
MFAIEFADDQSLPLPRAGNILSPLWEYTVVVGESSAP